MSQQNTNASGDRGPAPLSRSGLIIVTLCSVAATLMQALDGTIANVALPYMQGSMAASQDEINWVLTSYIIATAIMTAPVGFLAARFGRTRLFLTSIIGFSIASVLPAPRSRWWRSSGSGFCRACSAPPWCRCRRA